MAAKRNWIVAASCAWALGAAAQAPSLARGAEQPQGPGPLELVQPLIDGEDLLARCSEEGGPAPGSLADQRVWVERGQACLAGAPDSFWAGIWRLAMAGAWAQSVYEADAASGGPGARYWRVAADERVELRMMDEKLAIESGRFARWFKAAVKPECMESLGGAEPAACMLHAAEPGNMDLPQWLQYSGRISAGVEGPARRRSPCSPGRPTARCLS